MIFCGCSLSSSWFNLSICYYFLSEGVFVQTAVTGWFLVVCTTFSKLLNLFQNYSAYAWTKTVWLRFPPLWSCNVNIDWSPWPAFYVLHRCHIIGWLGSCMNKQVCDCTSAQLHTYIIMSCTRQKSHICAKSHFFFFPFFPDPWNTSLSMSCPKHPITKLSSLVADSQYLQWTTMGPVSGMVLWVRLTSSRNQRTPPGSLGTPWSGQLRYW